MILQALTLEQCEQVRLWRNNCLETLRTPYPLTKEMQEVFYRDVICNRNSPHRYWSIWDDIEIFDNRLPKTGILIGMGGITNIQWENRIGEISLIIDPALREKGYGEKAVDLLLDVAFNQMGLNCVYGECYATNYDGMVFWNKIVRKYDCSQVILRSRKFWQGKFWDSLYFDILKDEYDKISKTTNGTL